MVTSEGRANATGMLSVLNVGAGDIKVVFNKDNPLETAKAIRMLTDMQRRGYLIAVELPDGSYARATEIDALHARYIITVPDEAVLPAEAERHCACGCGSVIAAGKTWKAGHHRRGKAGVKGARSVRVSVPMHRARAIGVARSAGG